MQREVMPGKWVDDATGAIEWWDVADKQDWSDGPWLAEPDEAQWTDRATGLPCLIVRNIVVTGALCGYVGVTPGHPAYGLSYDGQDGAAFEAYVARGCTERPPPLPGAGEAVAAIEVHGGLTYAARCRAGDPAHAICHEPGGGQPDDVWWFGFDCSHLGDRNPRIEALASSRYVEMEKTHSRYRGFPYVMREVERLALQLAAIGGLPVRDIRIPDRG